jgi:hypothetical protein
MRREAGPVPSSTARSDLYDLFRFAGRPIAGPLVRRLWVLKV